MFSRRTKAILHVPLILFPLLVVCIGLVYSAQLKTHPSDCRLDPSQPGRSDSPAIHRIDGFRYQATIEGRARLSIEADRFLITRKRIGFLSFGMMNEARFERARIRVFSYSTPTENDFSSDYKDNEAFPLNQLPLAQGAPITEVSFSPVRFESFRDGVRQCIITADRGHYEKKDHSIRLVGNVCLSAGENRLFSDSLTVDPQSSRVRADSGYLLSLMGKTSRGHKLSSDLLLTSVSENK
jgi:hypothetical protein